MKNLAIPKNEKVKKEIIEIAKKIVESKAVNPSFGGVGEEEKANYIESLLKKEGFSVKRYDVKDKNNIKRPNLIIDLNFKQKKYLYLLAHLDVVPEGDLSLWSYNPFKLTVKENKLYGRGISDNGIGIISLLLLLKYFLKDAKDCNYNVKIFFLADEEYGSDYGLKWILKSTNEIKKGNSAIVPDFGVKEGNVAEIAEKSILWLKFTLIGKQAHGSLPNKAINANYYSSLFIIKLRDYLYRKFGKRNSLFIPPYSSFEPTRREENVKAINIIPGKENFYFDCRILPTYEKKKVIKEVKAFCRNFGKKYKVKIKVKEETFIKGSLTSKDSEVCIKLKECVKEVLKKKLRFIGIGGGTYAGLLRAKGIESVVWSKCSETEHLPNEYELIENFIDTANVFANVLKVK